MTKEEIEPYLELLYKALENGIWLKYKMGEDTNYLYEFVDKTMIHIGLEQPSYAFYSYYTLCSKEGSKLDLCIFKMEYEDVDICAYVKDYGKAWALTKEELL